MAMSVGGGGIKAEMNVTPMIDVLPVLIIICLVVMPTNSRGLDALVPQESGQESAAPRTDLVISIQPDKTVRINSQDPLPVEELGKRLKVLFGEMGSSVIFVRADRSLEFRQIADVIDIAKGAGFNRIALMTQ